MNEYSVIKSGGGYQSGRPPHKTIFIKGAYMPRTKEASERLRQASRRQLLDSARTLFARQGYFNCKIADITRQTGMSQGNFYWYFSSKEDVLKAILEEGFARQAALLEEANALPGLAREKLDFLIDQYLALAGEQGEFFTIMLSLVGHGGPELMKSLGFDLAEIGMSYHHSLSAIFTQAQAEGNLLPGEPDLLVMFFFAFFNGMMITYGTEWSQLPGELIQRAVLRLVGYRH
jgi:AcrR family transcriptional regulator